MEIWKTIIGYGDYAVSNKGRVKSKEREITRKKMGAYNVKERLLSQYVNKYGYKCVSLQKDNKRITLPVHRLVLTTFQPINNDDLQVNHKDGNKLNNSLDNLEWVTAKENIEHAQKMGLRTHFTKRIVKIEGNKKTYYNSVQEAEKENKCSHTQMWRWLKGKPNKKGVIFRYEYGKTDENAGKSV